jgi:hypothetical protein
MTRPASLLAAAGLLALSSPSFAAEEDPSGLHVGVALGGVYGLARNSRPVVDAGALNPTLHVDLGARINQYVSVYARGEAGTIILASQAAAYGIAEWTPVPPLHLGTGIGWDGMATWGGTGWSGPSIPLLAGFDVTHWDRSALRIGAEVAPGLEPSTSTWGWHAALTFGWVLN